MASRFALITTSPLLRSLLRPAGLGACALTLALACGDSGGTSTGSASGDATAGSTGQTTGSGGQTAGSTGDSSGATMGGTSGPGTSGPGTSGPGTSGPGTTGMTTEPATSGPDTTGGMGSTGGSTGMTSDTTGGGPGDATCQTDADCSLFTSCCDCDVLADGETQPACPIMECLVDVCSTYDLKDSKPVCKFGRCTFSKISCNPAGVICKSLPPTCGPGTLPTLNQNGDCWSGQCAPVEACDWAPDCASCATDKQDPLVCVFKAQKGAYHVCEPKPAACGDMAEIDCGCGAEICEKSPPHTVCQDNVPGITCECPFC